MSSGLRDKAARALVVAAFTAFGVAAGGEAAAAMITAGTPVDSVPSALVDPLFTLIDPLPQGQYLVPIQASGASGLVHWQFSLGFDAAVVALLDLGGLFGSVYQSEFEPGGPVSQITSSGLALPGLLEGISGFYFLDAVEGDGTLAFVLFELLDGASIDDADIRVLPPDTQPVPAPGTVTLAATALAGLAALRRRRPMPPPATPVQPLPPPKHTP